MAWTNAPLVVYHGTDEPSARRIVQPRPGSPNGIDLAVCSPTDVDFGQGFYVTTFRTEAEHWATLRATINGGLRPAVVSFEIDRDEIATLGDHLAFVLPDDGFFDFVECNRTGYPPHHARQVARPYDLVYGPISVHGERLHIEDWDQICFLSQRAVNCLKRAQILP